MDARDKAIHLAIERLIGMMVENNTKQMSGLFTYKGKKYSLLLKEYKS